MRKGLLIGKASARMGDLALPRTRLKDGVQASFTPRGGARGDWQCRHRGASRLRGGLCCLLTRAGVSPLRGSCKSLVNVHYF